jgi:hypothetical protein
MINNIGLNPFAIYNEEQPSWVYAWNYPYNPKSFLEELLGGLAGYGSLL